MKFFLKAILFLYLGELTGACDKNWVDKQERVKRIEVFKLYKQAILLSWSIHQSFFPELLQLYKKDTSSKNIKNLTRWLIDVLEYHQNLKESCQRLSFSCRSKKWIDNQINQYINHLYKKFSSKYTDEDLAILDDAYKNYTDFGLDDKEYDLGIQDQFSCAQRNFFS